MSGRCQEESGFRSNFLSKVPGESLLPKLLRIALQEANIGEQDILADNCLPSPSPASKQIALGRWGTVMSASLSGPPRWGSVFFGCEQLYSLHPEPVADCSGLFLAAAAWICRSCASLPAPVI